MKKNLFLIFLCTIIFSHIAYSQTNNRDVLFLVKKNDFLVYNTKSYSRKIKLQLKLPLSASDYLKIKMEAREYTDNSNPLFQALLNVASFFGIDKTEERIEDVLNVFKNGTGRQTFLLNIPMQTTILNLYSSNSNIFFLAEERKRKKTKRFSNYEKAMLYMAKYALYPDEDYPQSLINKFVSITTNHYKITKNYKYKKIAFNNNIEITTNTNVGLYNDNYAKLAKGPYTKFIKLNKEARLVIAPQNLSSIAYVTKNEAIYLVPLSLKKNSAFYLVRQTNIDYYDGALQNNSNLPMTLMKNLWQITIDGQNGELCELMQKTKKQLQEGDIVKLENSSYFGTYGYGKIISIFNSAKAKSYILDALDTIENNSFFIPSSQSPSIKTCKKLIEFFPELKKYQNKILFWQKVAQGDAYLQNKDTLDSAISEYQSALQISNSKKVKKKIKIAKKYKYRAYTWGIEGFYYNKSAIAIGIKGGFLNNPMNIGVQLYVDKNKKQIFFINTNINYYPILFLFFSLNSGLGIEFNNGDGQDIVGHIGLSINLDLKYVILRSGIDLIGGVGMPYYIGGTIKF